MFRSNLVIAVEIDNYVFILIKEILIKSCVSCWWSFIHIIQTGAENHDNTNTYFQTVFFTLFLFVFYLFTFIFFSSMSVRIVVS